MSKIIISSDSVSDLGPELIAKHSIPIVPLFINLGDTGKPDHDGMPEEIYAYVSATDKTPKTAARGIEEYTEFFKKHKPDGGEIVHFALSRELSASYQNALIAAKQVGGVYVVDTRSLSAGSGLCVMYGIDLKEQGESAEEIFKKCTERTKSVQASFVLDNLEYLHKGGRCNGVALFISTILSIKPMIALKDGKMIVGKKYISKFDKAVDKYVDDIMAQYNTPDLKRLFITHTALSKGIAERVKKRVLARFPFENVYDTVAGGTITSHCGKNTIGILYFNDGNKKL